MSSTSLITVVVPTYNERENIAVLIGGIHKALEGFDHDILFVDDSSDSTGLELMKIKEQDPTIDVYIRPIRTGLGTAIVDGLIRAKGERIIVMDADLQHPPFLLAAMAQEEGDVIIPSRFIQGGNDGGLNWYRKLISSVARYLGKFILKRVRPISDPTSGFFLVKRSVLEGVSLDPIGWKTLLDILVRGKYQRVIEIPYHFAPRHAGKSKLTTKASLDYLRHLGRLYLVQISSDLEKPEVIRLKSPQ